MKRDDLKKDLEALQQEMEKVGNYVKPRELPKYDVPLVLVNPISLADIFKKLIIKNLLRINDLDIDYETLDCLLDQYEADKLGYGINNMRYKNEARRA